MHKVEMKDPEYIGDTKQQSVHWSIMLLLRNAQLFSHKRVSCRQFFALSIEGMACRA